MPLKQHLLNILALLFGSSGAYFMLRGGLIEALVMYVFSYIFTVYALKMWFANIKKEIMDEMATKISQEIRRQINPDVIATFISSIIKMVYGNKHQTGGEGRDGGVRNRPTQSDTGVGEATASGQAGADNTVTKDCCK